MQRSPVEEYLTLERGSEERHEYLDGRSMQWPVKAKNMATSA